MSIMSSSSILAAEKYDFARHLKKQGVSLKRNILDTLQINIGKRCNQACHHCHVESSPIRTENMTKETVLRIVALIKESTTLKLVDITGGAPELNPHFQLLVTEIRKLGLRVIDRCNLTILLEPGQEGLAEFLAKEQVEIVASLPCYLEENVDKQRGNGAFRKSIEGLELLNRMGYGKENTGLVLNLVYNPIGAHLPPSQEALEKGYKEHLRKNYSIEFNNLITITNMPIKRFEEQLNREGKLETYMDLLVENYNGKALDFVMCRNLVSIGWDGAIYDCDFNQMLEIPINHKKTTVWDIKSFESFQEKNIATDFHCFGCTAGAGSSCGGALL